jgi:hypothetical protein
MRHVIGLILAIALSAALFFGGGWGVTHMSAFAAHSTGLPSKTGLVALAVLAGTGLLLGITLAVRAVSPLAPGLPGLVLLAWTALLAVSYRHGVNWVPLQGHPYGAGFRVLLTSGAAALAGVAMVIPLLVPSRWQRDGGEEDEDAEAALPAPTGLLS